MWRYCWFVVPLIAISCGGADDESGPGSGGATSGGATSSGATSSGGAGDAGRGTGGSGGGDHAVGGGAGKSGAASGDGAGKGAAASGGSPASGGGDGSGSAGTPDAGAGPGETPSICDAPALVPTTNPDRVIGDGTPASCTEDALRAAASEGGVIRFDCGSAPLTITVTKTVVFTQETVLDGNGTVTLSGGGSARILYLDSAYDQKTPRLTLERLVLRDGNSPAGGDDTAVGGGAVYRDGGSLTVLDCDFENNQAPLTGQDVAGGAIYGFGGGETVIARSSFRGNRASDGGAVGSLNGDLTIIDSSFTDNHATGTDGNPGNGGCGGAVYMDGGAETTTLCGVVIANNDAGAIAGGFFRVSNSADGTFTMDRSAVRDNAVTPDAAGNAGGMYLEGLALTLTASTISGNRAFYNGGLWISGRQASLTNVTIAENTAFGSNGAGLWLSHDPTGTILNSTIADNHSTADGQVAGAIFGSGLSLKNTIVSNNTAQYTPGCDSKHTSGGGNLEWPAGAHCSDGPTVADPELGALGDNGGSTETLLPAPTSSALGLGSDCPPTDQRGVARGEPCTAGAVEVQ
jgi:hypothetical protein